MLKGGDQPLHEEVEKIIVAVGTIMKINADGPLPTPVSGERDECRAHEIENFQS